MGEGLTLREKVYRYGLLIEIPGLPPSVNHTYGFSSKGGWKKPEVKRWEHEAQWLASQTALKAYGSFKLEEFRGLPIKLEMSFIRPSWRSKRKPKHYVRPDVSNFIKVTEDSVCKALGLEDSAVVEVTALKIERSGPVRTEVRFNFVNERGN